MSLFADNVMQGKWLKGIIMLLLLMLLFNVVDNRYSSS